HANRHAADMLDESGGLIDRLRRNRMHMVLTVAADTYGLARQTESAPPNEADYQAFHDALMDDERGRWFLTEYSRRNRNADTGLLLKALDRIEALVRLGTPDVFDRLRQELRAIVETIRQARAEALDGAEALRGDRLLALLDQVERRIDAMIGEPAGRPRETPQPETFAAHLAIVPTPEPVAAEFEAPAASTVSAAMMPPVAWAAGDTATVAEAPAVVVEAAFTETAPADIAPSPPGNENEPAVTEPEEVAAEIPAEPVLQNWITAPTEPIAVAFGDAQDVTPQLLGTGQDFVIPAADMPAAEAVHVNEQEQASEPVSVVAQEAAQEAVQETAQAIAQGAMPDIEQTAVAEPTAEIAIEQAYVPFEIEPPVQAKTPAAVATPQVETAEVTSSEAGTFEAIAAEPARLGNIAPQAPASEITDSTPAGTATTATATDEPAATLTAADDMEKAMAEIAMAINSTTIEERIAAANSLPALAALSEEERLALFT